MMSLAEQFSLTGKTALVTGASRGIGRAIALGLAEAGADVAVCARSETELRKLAEEIEALGRRGCVRPVDLNRPDEAAAVLPDVESQFGPIDTVVYAAGTTVRRPIEELQEAEWDEILNVNLKSAHLVCQAAGKSLLARGQTGSLILIASLTSHGARPTILPYTVSKGGIASLTQALAVEWGPKGIRTNAIAPGYILTDMTQSVYDDPTFHDWVLARAPLGRWGQPEDLAPLAVFLAADGSAYINGQIIYADGGWTAAM